MALMSHVLKSDRNCPRSYLAPGMKQLSKFFAKLLDQLKPLRRSLHYFTLRLKDLPPVPFGEDTHYLAHAPARSAQNLQPVDARNQKRDTIVTYHSNAFGKALKGSKFESRNVKTLELFGGVGHGNDSSRDAASRVQAASALTAVPSGLLPIHFPHPISET